MFLFSCLQFHLFSFLKICFFVLSYFSLCMIVLFPVIDFYYYWEFLENHRFVGKKIQLFCLTKNRRKIVNSIFFKLIAFLISKLIFHSFLISDNISFDKINYILNIQTLSQQHVRSCSYYF